MADKIEQFCKDEEAATLIVNSWNDDGLITTHQLDRYTAPYFLQGLREEINKLA